VEVFYF